MATTKNKNLFYQLYSNKNDVASSGYKCKSNVDEEYTSFDISGSEALVTDSNGNILSSLSLGDIHVDELTQYNIETKVLQPHSTYLLQGPEYGEAHMSFYFRIPKSLSDIGGYENYCNIGFDISYKQKNKPVNLHILSRDIRETYGSFTKLVLSLFDKLKVPVSISIKLFEDPGSSETIIDYIEFMGTEDGYEYMIRNVILYPLLASEGYDFEDSPFSPVELSSDTLMDILTEVKPRPYGDMSNKNYIKNYSVSCSLYKTLLQFGDIITDDFNTFCYEFDIFKDKFVPCYDKYSSLIIYPKQLEELKEQYPQITLKFYDEELEQYNIFDLVEIFELIKTYIFNAKSATGPNNCFEDLDKRINNIKYHNGAMKGCIILPVWPEDDEYEYNVLLVHHVSDLIEISVPVEIKQLNKYFNGNIISNHNTRLYEKAIAYVQINALIPDERDLYIKDDNNLPLNDITSNDGFTSSFDDMQIPGYDTHDYILNDFQRIPIHLKKQLWDDKTIEYFHPDMYVDNSDIDDNNIWETTPNKTNTNVVDTHQMYTTKYIGLYRYMEYLSKNDLWLRIGDSYMITGKNDNPDSPVKNLLSSAIIYNPNDIPIRIRCMIFA